MELLESKNNLPGGDGESMCPLYVKEPAATNIKNYFIIIPSQTWLLKCNSYFSLFFTKWSVIPIIPKYIDLKNQNGLKAQDQTKDQIWKKVCPYIQSSENYMQGEVEF